MYRLVALLLFPAMGFAQGAPAPHQVTNKWTWAQGTGDPATGFNVKRATVSGGPYVTVGTVACAAGSCAAASTQYTSADVASATNVLTEGTTYFYVVTATGPGGESAVSNETSVKIPAAAPPAPTSLTSTAQ